MDCHHFTADRCRSCPSMGIPYALQLATKDRLARETLASVAPGIHWSDPESGPESGFRNKAKLVVGGSPGAPTLGILDRAGGGVDLRDCGLYEPGLAAALPVLAEFVASLGLRPYDVPTRSGELKHLIVTHSPDGELLVRFVLRSEGQLGKIRAALPEMARSLPGLAVASVNLHPEHKAVLEGEEEVVLTERTTLPMRVNDLTLELGVRSFFQTNTAMAAALYAQACGWVEDLAPATVLDLYSGVGGFALHCATRGRSVHGVEVSAEAVRGARESARRLAAVNPAAVDVTFTVGDATAYLRPEGHAAPDLVIVNPPRRGIGPELCAALEASQTSAILYSSCNPVSLARDLALLPSFGATRARVFDMFPQTDHLEVLVRLDRRLP